MKLKRVLLRYYPPGILLEYTQQGNLHTRKLELPTLKAESNINEVVDEISNKEPLINDANTSQIKLLIKRLQSKIAKIKYDNKYTQHKILKTHLLPVTSVSFNKPGSKFITSSYDRTCCIWNTEDGKLLNSLEGHGSVVYKAKFNNPYGNKIVTISFDKTCKLWDTATGKCNHTYRGYKAELVCLDIHPQSTTLATGTMKNEIKICDVESGVELHSLSKTLKKIFYTFSGSECDSEYLIESLTESESGAPEPVISMTGKDDVTPKNKIFDRSNVSIEKFFRLLFTNNIMEIIVNCTNMKIADTCSKYSRPRDEKLTNSVEMNAYIGILFISR
ncbi:Outer row dynein assembly protein 16, partial [Intoshia linei]